jgi:hypothetical protein
MEFEPLPMLPELVRRAFLHNARVASTPHDVPLSPHEDPEVERLAALTPTELAAEIVAGGYLESEAARIVEGVAIRTLRTSEIVVGEA